MKFILLHGREHINFNAGIDNNIIVSVIWTVLEEGWFE